MHEWCIILKPYISNSAYHAISSLKYHLNDPHKNNNKCSNRSGKWHYNGIINNTVGCIKLLKGSHIYSRYHFWFIQRCLLVCQCFANALSWKNPVLLDEWWGPLRSSVLFRNYRNQQCTRIKDKGPGQGLPPLSHFR